jgi:hypothetical protein
MSSESANWRFTNRDRRLLQKQRLDRFRALFPQSLKSSLLALRANHQLSIHCAEAWMVDELLSEVDRLRWYTWMVLGVQQVAICFAEEEIYSTATHCWLEVN